MRLCRSELAQTRQKCRLPVAPGRARGPAELAGRPCNLRTATVIPGSRLSLRWMVGHPGPRRTSADTVAGGSLAWCRHGHDHERPASTSFGFQSGWNDAISSRLTGMRPDSYCRWHQPARRPSAGTGRISWTRGPEVNAVARSCL